MSTISDSEIARLIKLEEKRGKDFNSNAIEFQNMMMIETAQCLKSQADDCFRVAECLKELKAYRLREDVDD